MRIATTVLLIAACLAGAGCAPHAADLDGAKGTDASSVTIRTSIDRRDDRMRVRVRLAMSHAGWSEKPQEDPLPIWLFEPETHLTVYAVDQVGNRIFPEEALPPRGGTGNAVSWNAVIQYVFHDPKIPAAERVIVLYEGHGVRRKHVTTDFYGE